MTAICFKCGGRKNDPLRMCSSCHALPESEQDRLISLALSSKCLKDKNLLKASEYIQRKKRPPRFSEGVKEKARQLLEASAVVANNSQSIELSASFFEFDDLREEPKKRMVTVHSIGKPANLSPDHRGPISRDKTYRVFKWEIGTDISEEMAKQYIDALGCIYVWYRWLEDKWVWKCVTKSEFSNLRKVEK